MKWSLSVWTAFFVELPLEKAVDEYAAAGYTAAELSDEHGAALLATGEAPEKIGARMRAYAADRGLVFPQGHLWLKANIIAPGATDILKKWLELFNALGIRSAVLHASGSRELPPEESFEKRVTALRELTDFLKGTDVTICIENTSGTTIYADGINELIDAAGGEHLGICLDTGHLRIAQERGLQQSQREFIEKAGPRLKALHIADNDGSSDQHLMPYGRGNVNWQEVVSALKANGYKDLFNLEIPGERRCPIEVRRAKLAYIKSMYDYMYDNF